MNSNSNATLIRVSGFVSALLVFALVSVSQTPPPPAAPKKAVSKAAPKAPLALTNKDIIRLVQAKISDDIIIGKIKNSKTRFDSSVDGLIALREAGVSERLMAVILNPADASSALATKPDSDRKKLSDTTPPPQPSPEPNKLQPGLSPSNAAQMSRP